jgi:hypothetical protein
VETSRFRDREGNFPVLDLIASFDFKSSSSISFLLGRFGDMIRLTDMDWPVGPGRVFEVVGQVIVHHPCEGHIKAQLLVLLPVEYHEIERMKELIRVVFVALAIPLDDTFDSLFVSPERQIGYMNDVDREGMSEWI